MIFVLEESSNGNMNIMLDMGRALRFQAPANKGGGSRWKAKLRDLRPVRRRKDSQGLVAVFNL
jgi:hypothetical protein